MVTALPAERPGAWCALGAKESIHGLCLFRLPGPILRSGQSEVRCRDAMMVLIRELSATEAAYVAGIVDGEGTITLTRTHRDEGRRPVVSISSTELPLLQYIHSVIGAGRITGKVTTRDHHSPSFAYVISGRQALALLSQISGYLRTTNCSAAACCSMSILQSPRGTAATPPLSARQRNSSRRASSQSPFAPEPTVAVAH